MKTKKILILHYLINIDNVSSIDFRIRPFSLNWRSAEDYFVEGDVSFLVYFIWFLARIQYIALRDDEKFFVSSYSVGFYCPKAILGEVSFYTAYVPLLATPCAFQSNLSCSRDPLPSLKRLSETCIADTHRKSVLSHQFCSSSNIYN